MTRRQKRDLTRVLAAGALFAVALFLPLSGWMQGVCFALPYLVVGYPVLRKSVLSLLRGEWMNEAFLMTVASLGAFFLGEYAEGVAVMLFSAVGELFESYAVGKSRNSVTELMSLCPDRATVLREGEWVSLSPEEVGVGETVRVLSGEKIPLDGTVLKGRSSLDTRSLTGESLPRDVEEGDAVFSGCVNLSGVLELRVEKPFEESTASRILALVEDATSHRTKTETFVASFARWYTPLVIALALLVGTVPPLIFGEWSVWIYRALEFLVVSCPCALVISVPLTYFGAIGGASRRGILVKGSDRLDALAKVRSLVFDKTGTLTKGVFEVVSAEGENPKEILLIAALCEQYSNHPIALSLRNAWGEDLPNRTVSDLTERAGLGVSASVDGVTYFVGNEAWMRCQGLTPYPTDAVGTRVFVGNEQACLGVITLADRVKENAADAIASLRRLGIRRMTVLSGDRKESVERVAEALELDGFSAELLPEHKVEEFRALASASSEEIVAFVGDGMNDAPVLAAAPLGIAMGGIGSDAAIEAADVVLMRDDLSALPVALSLARKARRIVLQNLVFAIGVKILVLVLCTMGFADMWYAVFADVGVSVLAILNAMRTLSKKN